MSICSQRCASRSVTRLHRFHLSTTSEPLLFLYPPCFRHALARPYHIEHRLGRGPHYEPSPSPSQSPSPLTTPSHLRHNPSPYNAVRVQKLTTSLTSRSGPTSTQQASGKEHALPTQRSTHANPRNVPRKATGPSPDEHDRHSFWNHPIDKPETTPTLFRKILRIKPRYLRPADGAQIYREIRSISPNFRAGETQHIHLTLPRETIRNLVGTAHANSWIHHEGSHCRITVTTRPLDNNMNIELEGSAHACELAKKFLLTSDTYMEPLQNDLWATNIRSQLNEEFAAIPTRPPIWTIKSFHQFVYAMTYKRLSRTSLRYNYPGSISHDQAVARELEAVFVHRKASLCVSNSALQLALQFFATRPGFSTTPLRLWTTVKELGLRLDVQCYNEELKRCLIAKDNKRFCELVVSMRNSSVIPDGETWSVAISYAQDPVSRFEILSALNKEFKLVSDRDRQAAARALVRRDLPEYLKSPDGFSNFVSDMRLFLGEDWVTQKLMARCLRVCRIRHAKVRAASDIISWMWNEHSLAVDKACLIELTLIAAKAGHVKETVTLLKAWKSDYSRSPYISILEAVFITAWRNRYLNTCRVVWVQACLTGCTSHQMQRLVQSSLNAGGRENPDNLERMFYLRAGRLIIGTNLDLKGVHTLLPSLFKSKQYRTLTEIMFTHTRHEERHEQLQLMQFLLERDLNAWRFYRKPTLDGLRKSLDSAMATDQAWLAANTLQMADPATLVSKVWTPSLQRRQQFITTQNATSAGAAPRRWFVLNGHNVDYNTLTPDPEQTAPQVMEGLSINKRNTNGTLDAELNTSATVEDTYEPPINQNSMSQSSVAIRVDKGDVPQPIENQRHVFVPMAQ